MPALDPNSTPRAFLTYNVDMHDHTLMVRLSSGMSDGDVSEELGDFLTIMGGQLTECTFVKFERSITGSNVRNPAVWSGPTTWGAGEQLEEFAFKFWSFTGKDSNGHKTRVDLFGRHLADNENMRVYSTEDTTIADAVTALNAASDIFQSVGGLSAFWNAYGNESVAQHWVKQLRK